ncbi:MAG: phage holin family protein [Candidatus Saccharimonadia bacterium]
MLKSFLLRWLVNFLGLWMAATLLTGITYEQRFGVLIIAALIFSIVNALIRPLVVLLTLPAILLTLGLFTLVINTFMLYLVSFFYPKFQINSVRAGILAVIIVWIVNYLMTDLIEHKPAT